MTRYGRDECNYYYEYSFNKSDTVFQRSCRSRLQCGGTCHRKHRCFQSNFYQDVSAATPAQYGLTEGDRITANNAAGDPDIHIINDWGYRRLILNPAIAGFYGHLGAWPTQFLARTKQVTAATRDAFTYSGLFRNCENNDQQVWAYEFTGEDTGVIHKVVMTGDQAVAQDAMFFNKVFCINTNEYNWFSKSTTDYTSLSQIMTYSRTPGSTPTWLYQATECLACCSPCCAYGYDQCAGSRILEVQRVRYGHDQPVRLQAIRSRQCR